MLKTPFDIQQQIAQFQKHGVLMQDERAATSALNRVSYYRLSGYALEFRMSPHADQYVPGTKFEDIYARYQFDEELRHILRRYLEMAEVFYRTQIANVFSMLKCSQPPHEQHYDTANYYKKEYFNGLMEQVAKETRYFKDSLFIQHHMSKYKGHMPLWVLVEVMSFSTLSKYYSCMYTYDQEAIASHLNTNSRILRNHLHAMSVLRNKCAHAARLYNTQLNPKVVLPKRMLRNIPSLKTDTVFAYLVMLAYRLPDCNSKNEYVDDIIDLLDRYQDKVNLNMVGIPYADKKCLLSLLSAKWK